MPTIRQLSTSLINKIAAGEVIERPASVVKEMLENSVDAGATFIELAVEKGGADLVRIHDNGSGIAADELLLAVAPHATSKIVEADDLFDVHTLGFRGEALASIAEISHLLLRSRTADSESGAELMIRGGQLDGPQPCAARVGTTIEVRHLFFNTPVRRKFMKSAQTEMGHVTEAFTRIALAFPNIHFVLQSNDRTLYDLPPTERWSERIRTFFGDEIADALIYVENEEPSARLRGYVADPSVSRSNNRMQYLFLNGRHIRDRALQHAMGEAYRGLLMVGRFPICFLRIDMPASEVDVNVHPTKTEVRFHDSGRLYSQVLQCLRHKFLSTDLTAQVRHSAGANAHDSEMQPASQARVDMDSTYPPCFSLPAVSSHTDALLNWARGGNGPVPNAEIPAGTQGRNTVPAFRPFDGGFGSSSVPRPNLASNDKLFNPTSSDRRQDIGREPSRSLEQGQLQAETSPEVIRFDSQHQRTNTSHLGFQVHNRYLITEDDHGMVVIDQHALHERVLYEQIREKVLGETLESQRLLVPEPVSLTPAEAAAALDAQELLGRVGICVEPFGGDTVLVTAYPAMLSNISPAEMLRQVLEPLITSGKEPEARDLLDSLLHMIACKAAIKAGDRLQPEEITALLEQRHLFADTHHCPHGRPTALFFSREQLDKMFKRT